MSAKDILNADMTTISRWLREGFHWWLTEIAELVPERWRGSLMRGAPEIAEVHGDEIVVGEGTAGKRAVTLLLPPSAVLMREIELPVVAGTDIRRMVALDIDRLTPFRADAVLFDTVVTGRDPEGGRQRVLVGAVARSAMEDVLARARAQSLEPKVIAANTNDGPQFDFLAALRRTKPGSAKRTAMWWAVAGGLAAANILAFIYTDQSSLDELRDAVDSQQATVTVAERLRRKVDAEALRRVALMEKAQRTPLAALAAVTAALPDTGWVQRFEWTGRSVHLTSHQKGTVNVTALLEASPALVHAKGTQTPTAVGTQTFDIAADIAPTTNPAVRR